MEIKFKWVQAQAAACHAVGEMETKPAESQYHHKQMVWRDGLLGSDLHTCPPSSAQGEGGSSQHALLLAAALHGTLTCAV